MNNHEIVAVVEAARTLCQENWDSETAESVLPAVVLLLAGRGSPISGDDAPIFKPAAERSEGGGPLHRVARASGIPVDALERVIAVSDAGAVSVLGRPQAPTTMRAFQTAFMLAYSFVREIGFSEPNVDLEDVRKLCTVHHVYDAKNFASNVKKDVSDGLIVEMRDGGRRLVRLTRRGTDGAMQTLREITQV